MRSLYSLLLYLLMPLVLLYLLFRGLRSRDYLSRWSERFGFFDPPERTGGIWIHAVSMGEVNAATPLIRALENKYPDGPLIITTFTPTGSARVREVFGDRAFHVFSPLDLPGAVSRFLDRVKPRFAVILETEIWPNLLHQSARRNVPCMIANARISDHSIDTYRRFRRLTAGALRDVSRIAAQSRKDADRLVSIGAAGDRITVTGNLKFDIDLPAGLDGEGQAIRQQWGEKRPVLVAGSTHEADEKVLLSAFGSLLAEFPDALLVLVPRHPERFERAALAAKASGLTVARLSENGACPPGTQCFVVDAIGELLRYYAAGDIAFVGGTFAEIGGHNLLEPAALSRPVIVGPHTFNAPDIAAQLIDAGAAVRVESEQAAEEILLEWFRNPALIAGMGRAGFEQVQKGQGAVNRTLDVIESMLTEAAG
jgi:3-deoxy-D-manno-octulosonic-acid transferase